MKEIMTSEYAFFAADTPDSDPKIPEGVLRVYSVSVQVTDLPLDSVVEKHGKYIRKQAEGDPVLSKALLKLKKWIGGNECILKEVAKTIKSERMQ